MRELSKRLRPGARIANPAGMRVRAMRPTAAEGSDRSSSGCTAREVTLTDGSTVVADDEYLRRSITDPDAQRVEGYAVNMPANDLEPSEIEAVLAYIRELGPTP